MHETRPPSPHASEPFVDLVDLFESLRRRAHWIAAVCALSLVAAAVGTRFQTPLYESTSTLLVKFGREFMSDPTSSDNRLVGRSRETLLNSEIEILRSRPVLEGMVSRVGAETLYPELAEEPAERRRAYAADRAFDALSANAVDETELIRAAFFHADPEIAAQAMTAILDEFRAKHLDAFSDASAVALFEDTVANDTELLREAEADLQAFEAEHRAFHLAAPDRMLMDQRVELQSALNAVEAQLADARQLLTDEPRPLSQARTDLLALELEREELLGRYEETSLPVGNLTARIVLLQRFLADRVAENRASREANLRPLKRRRQSLLAELREFESQIAGLPELQAKHRALTRQRDAVEARYQSRLAQLDEHRMSQEMGRRQIANIRVVQAPAAPLEPVGPSLALNLLVGALVGLMLGVALALMGEHFDQGGAGRPSQEDVTEDDSVVDAREQFKAPEPIRASTMPMVSHWEVVQPTDDRVSWPEPMPMRRRESVGLPVAFHWKRAGIGLWVREPSV